MRTARLRSPAVSLALFGLSLTTACTGSEAPRFVPPAPDTDASGDAPALAGAPSVEPGAEALVDLPPLELTRSPATVLQGELPDPAEAPVDPVVDPGADKDRPRPEVLPPSGAITTLIEQDERGSSVRLRNGRYDLRFRFGNLVMRDGQGAIVGRIAAQPVAPVEQGSRIVFRRLYGDGTSLELHTGDGQLRRILRIQNPLEIPAEAEHFEVVETLNASPELTARAGGQRIAPGQVHRTLTDIELVDPAGRTVFYIPAPSSWDAARNPAWMFQRIALEADGRGDLVTSLPAAWLRDPARRYPVAIDPSVLAIPFQPVVGSLFIAPVSPGSMRTQVAVTFTDWVLSELNWEIDWGDGTVMQGRGNTPVRRHYDYQGVGVYEVRFQVCDDSLPPVCDRGERFVPAGPGDACADLNDECNLWEYDERRGYCYLAVGNGLPCDVDCAVSADCQPGEWCNPDGFTCEADCTHPEARACGGVSTACFDAGCNPDTLACDGIAKPDGAACDDGQFCTAFSFCQSGQCEDANLGGPCDLLGTACDEVADACEGGALAACSGDLECASLTDGCNIGICGSAGRCIQRPIPDGVPCEDGAFCTNLSTCQAGSCEDADAGNPCGGGTCNETTDQCEGGGAGECANDADCAGQAGVCEGAKCNLDTGACEVAALPDGTPVDDGLFCTIGSVCTDGAPADAGLGDPCSPISLDCDEASDACTVPGGTACLGDADCAGLNNGCTRGICNTGSGFCESVTLPNGSSCSDGDFCNGAESCMGGACVAGVPPCLASGRPCNEGNDTCGPANPECTSDCDCEHLDNQCQRGSCNTVTGSCETRNLDNGTACDDGQFCTLIDTCQNGGCVGGGPAKCTAPSTCNEGADRCDFTPPPGTCNNDADCRNVAGEGPCTDWTCVLEDVNCRTIEGGQFGCIEACFNTPFGSCCDNYNGTNCCVPNAGVVCDTRGTCQNTVIPGTNCNDNDGCTTADVCVGRECVGQDKCLGLTECNPANAECVVSDGCTTDADCDNDCDPCTVGVCEPITGTCITEVLPNDTPCEDGNFCSLLDSCQGGTCTPGDLDPCAELGFVCNDDTNTCDLPPDACQTNEDCEVTGDACEIAICNPLNGQCIVEDLPDGAPCDDGQFCTLIDTCTGGTCGGSVDPCEPIERTCNEGSDSCDLPPGSCASNEDCRSEDGVCTFGVCNPVNGECLAVQAPDGTPCDDGLFCTALTRCEAGACTDVEVDDPCKALGLACNEDANECEVDGIPCTDDLDCIQLTNLCEVGACNTFTGECVTVPTEPGIPCDDGEECTANDRCDISGECRGQDNCCDPNDDICMGTIGDSIGEGTFLHAPGVARLPLEYPFDHSRNWSSGRNEDVNSVGRRAGDAVGGSWDFHNAAIAGSVMFNFEEQAHRICNEDVLPNVVSVSLGQNDVCVRDESELPDPVVFIEQMSRGLEVLSGCLDPSAIVVVHSIIRVDLIWPAAIEKSALPTCPGQEFTNCFLAWGVAKDVVEFPICDVITSLDVSQAQRDNIGLLVDDINTQVREEVGRWDGSEGGRNPRGVQFFSDFTGTIAEGHLNESLGNARINYCDLGADCFHPSVMGQNKIACVAWKSHPLNDEPFTEDCSNFGDR